MSQAEAALEQRALQMLHVAREHHVRGALDDARKLYREVLRVRPAQPDAVALLGLAEFQKGNLAEAERLLLRAVKLRPEDPNVRVNLGALQKRLRKLPQAVQTYRAAIRLNAKLVEAHYNLGGAYFEQEEFMLAIGAYTEALRLNPAHVETLVNLGNAYKRAARQGTAEWTKAIEHYDRALAIKPDFPEAYANIGSTFRDQDWHHAAILMYDKALAISPGLHQYRFKRAMVELPIGRLAAGWDDYEFRFQAEGESFPKRPGPPYWEGEDISAKKIFVWPEQGLGDQILFGSMLPDLIARAGKVRLESKPRLAALFARSLPGAEVVERRTDDDEVDPADSDCQISLASLGRFFRRDVASFPSCTDYLKVDVQKAAAIRGRYEKLAAGRRIVGISWRSKNDRFGALKTSDLTTWGEILRVPGIMFVNLQYGDCRSDLAAVRKKLGVEILQDKEVDPMGDLDDFFAQVAALDLVVSTSNTTVHASGSLNVPTWLILPHGMGILWYWFVRRQDSPWYPSMRIFRSGGDPAGDRWSPVLTEVGTELARWVAK